MSPTLLSLWRRATLWNVAASMLLVAVFGCEDDSVPEQFSIEEADSGCLICGEDASGNVQDTDIAMEDTTPDATPDVAPDTTPEDTGVEADAAPDVMLTRVIVAVETQLSAETLSAGDTLTVTCAGLDEMGEAVDLLELEQRINTLPDSTFDRGAEPGTFVPTVVGSATVTCALPSLGLIDTTPAQLEITPGPPHTVLTELDRHNVKAGERVLATCTAYDIFGNIITDSEPRLLVDPFGEGVLVEGRALIVRRSGIYTASCHVDGAQFEIADIVEVSPGKPASLVVSLVPDQPSYKIGQVVEVVASVEDMWNNAVTTAVVDFVSNPPGTSFGAGRFRYDAEGVYAVGATVERADDEPLTAGISIVVNETGPSIECVSPADGAMITAAEGSSVNVAGTVADANGVSTVRINGVLAQLDPTGTFQLSQTARFGINFVDIEATDEFGVTNSRTCAYMAADSWAEEQTLISDSVALRMGQAAFDDGNRSGEISSLADMLHTALNSNDLLTTLDGALSGASPFINRCVQDSFAGCLFRLRVDYNSLSNRGTNTAVLDLENGGMRITATIPELWVRINIGGTVSTSGWAKMYGLVVELSFDASLQNGQPQVTLDTIHRVDVNRVDTDFSGLAGFVIDILVDLFNGTVKNLLRDQVRNYIRDSFDEILDSVFSGLDINSLGTSFQVPRLVGDGNISMGFGLGFSHLNFNNDRALFGLGVRFTAPAGHSIPSPGVPMPPGAVRLDPNTGRPIAAAVHVSVLNQALHTLWRAGLLEATLGGDSIGGGLPEGTSATIRALMPPVMRFEEQGRARAMLGGIRAELVYPGLFDTPVTIYLGGTATTGVRLVGETLEFEDITLDELYFSAEDIALDPTTRAILEDFLRMLLQSLLNDTLNGALPVLPIPAFDLPTSLSEFGLPGGRTLGILQPNLVTTPNHATLEGSFGLQ